jgi:hypothetical protein
MIELSPFFASILVPALLGAYALTFFAGGVYYLEQRVARIRDQFPSRGPISRLVGYAALGIGLLAASAVAGHLLDRGPQSVWAALVATTSGVGFWVVRLHLEMTLAARIRDTLLALLCLALTVLTGWWATAVGGVLFRTAAIA